MRWLHVEAKIDFHAVKLILPLLAKANRIASKSVLTPDNFQRMVGV